MPSKGGRVKNTYYFYKKNEAGMAAVEFAILAPVILLILVAIIEFGSLIFSRISTNAAIASVTNTILLSENLEITAQYAAELAGQIKDEAYVGTVTVNLNDAYIATIDENNTLSSGGNGDEAACYCPLPQGTLIEWGSAEDCGIECTNQMVNPILSGKFATVQASFSPPLLFGRFLSQDYLGQLSAVVRIE